MRVEQIGDATLYLGDCLEVLPSLGKVDAVVTDPPYGIPVGAAFVRGGINRIHDGSGSFNEGDTWSWLKSHDWLSAGANIAVFHRREDCIPTIGGIRWWHKFYLIKSNPPPSVRRVFQSGVEECSIGNKEGKRVWNGKGVTRNYIVCPVSDTERRDIDHDSIKPTAAIRVLVSVLTDRGTTVLDPFMGSGTTGVACANLGRRFIGIEIEPKYFDIACKRIEDAYKQPRLFEDEPIRLEQQVLAI